MAWEAFVRTNPTKLVRVRVKNIYICTLVKLLEYSIQPLVPRYMLTQKLQQLACDSFISTISSSSFISLGIEYDEWTTIPIPQVGKKEKGGYSRE